MAERPQSSLPALSDGTAAPQRPLSVLRVLGSVVVVLVATVAAQAVLGAVVAAIMALGGYGNPAAAMSDILATPAGFIPMALVAQLAMVVVLWVIVSRAPDPWREQLGFKRSGVPAWGLAAFVLGTVFAALAGVVVSGLVGQFLPSSDLAEKLWARVTWASGTCYVLFVAIVPGIVEELFFRGYVQRRLLRRWRPAGAILMSSALFSIMHLEPAWAAFAFPMGVWLGVIAWRTDSVRPGMLCHACLNGLWNVYFIGAAKLETPESAHRLAAGLAAATGLVGLIGGLMLLIGRTPTAVPESVGTGAPLPVARPVATTSGPAALSHPTARG